MNKTADVFCKLVKENRYNYKSVEGIKRGEQQLAGESHTSATRVCECPPDYYRSQQLDSTRPKTVFNDGCLWVAHSETGEYNRTTVSGPNGLHFPSRSVTPVKLIYSNSKVETVTTEKVSGRETVVVQVTPGSDTQADISESKIEECRLWISTDNAFPIKYLTEFEHGYSRGVWEEVEFDRDPNRTLPESAKE